MVEAGERCAHSPEHEWTLGEPVGDAAGFGRVYAAVSRGVISDVAN
jgi:hypothetical protein